MSSRDPEYSSYNGSSNGSNWPPPQKFQVILSKNTFVPGELVKGEIVIQTDEQLMACALRVELEGVGQSSFEVENTFHNPNHTYSHVYARCRRTVWGSVHKAPEVNLTGCNFLYGPPWAPDEGVLCIPVEGITTHIVVRVMCDKFWPDYVLGEISLDIERNLNQGVVEVSLERNGSPDQGLLSFSMADCNNPVLIQAIREFGTSTDRLIELKVWKVNCLKVECKDSYVHVQAYPIAEGSEARTGLSLIPPEHHMLPPCTVHFPFEFKLPCDLPSSIVKDKNNWICYSITAYVDQSVTKPGICLSSSQTYFTVVQPIPSALLMTPTEVSITYPLHEEMSVLPFCCSLDHFFPWEVGPHVGYISLGVKLARNGFAPGEEITFEVHVQSNWRDIHSRLAHGKARLVQRILTQDTHGCKDESFHVKAVEYFTPKSGEETRVSFGVPSIPPSYSGGLEYDSFWFEQAAKFAKGWEIYNQAPIIWGYFLEINIGVVLRGSLCKMPRCYNVFAPLIISSVGLELLPPFIDENGFEAPKPQKYVIGTNMLVPPDWKRFPQVESVLPSLAILATAPAYDYDRRNDCSMHRPMYFINPTGAA